jgi:hypothetical protein
MLAEHLQKYCGFSTLKPGQREIIERILRRQSAPSAWASRLTAFAINWLRL